MSNCDLVCLAQIARAYLIESHRRAIMRFSSKMFVNKLSSGVIYVSVDVSACFASLVF